MTYLADKQLTNGLGQFAATRQGARRFHKEAIGDVDPEHCFADWLLRVARNDTAGIEKSYGRWLPDGVRSGPDSDVAYRLKTAMATGGDGTLGGYLVPQQLLTDLMIAVSEEAFIRPLAHVVPMKSATMLLPLPDAATTPSAAGVSPFFGGINMQWTQEAATRPETEPKFRLVELHAWELSGYLYLSNPLAQDGMALDSWLKKLIALSLAWYEDYAFLRGTGTGQPVGMLNSNATINFVRGTGGTGGGSGKIILSDFAGMLADLLPFSYLHAAWFIAVSAMKQVTKLVDDSGKAAWVPNYPADGGAAGAEDGKGGRSIGSVFGRAAFVSEKSPALGSTGDLMLLDPTLYVIGDRKAVEITVSKHEPTSFKANQQAWRVVHRVDGQPWFSKSITLQDTSTVVSPYIALQ